MKVILLHKDVYMPLWMQSKVNVVLSKYKDFVLSKHVRDHAIEDEDRSHGYTLSKLELALGNFFHSDIKDLMEAFEVEMTHFDLVKPHWLITKICIRLTYSYDQDVCLSIRTYKDPKTNKYIPSKAFVVTAWLNNKNDKHFTLDESKYLTEEEFINCGKLYCD